MKTTNELEKHFFDTFGIGYTACTDNFSNPCKFECDECQHCEDRYPQITDRILLELICKLSGVCCPHFAFERDVEELKEAILKFCIYYKDQLKHQVRTLFEEG